MGCPTRIISKRRASLRRLIREGGAIPATMGVIAGVPTVGLDAASTRTLRTGTDVRKLARRDLGVAIGSGLHGATTVAATMALAAIAGIEVFATGGIGGVHRGARESWDISGDLTELGRTPVLVVCAGAKAILDLPATLEYLETLGVPVVGYGCDEFPAFYSAHSGLRLNARADTPEQVAAIWRAHLQYGGGGGLLLCVPPPAEDALPADLVEDAITRALAQAGRCSWAGSDPIPAGGPRRTHRRPDLAYEHLTPEEQCPCSGSSCRRD